MTHKAGVGSNQYRDKGRSTQRERAAALDVHSAMERIEIESVAAAFVNGDDSRAMQAKTKRASNPDVFISAAAHPDVRVRFEAARSLRCPPAVLDILATDREQNVRMEVARNPASPTTAIEAARAVCPNDPQVIEEVFEHPAASAEMIASEWERQLANADSGQPGFSPYVNRMQERLLKHPNCPEDLLRRGYPVEAMRSACLKNPACPLDILEHAAADLTLDSKVRRLAMTNPGYPPERLHSFVPPSGKAPTWVLGHPDCPPVIVDQVAKWWNTDVDLWARKVISHPNVTDYALHRVALNSDDPNSLATVAQHPKASTETLRMVGVNPKTRNATRRHARARVADAEANPARPR